MIRKIIRALWGDLTNDEIKKFGILAVTFFFVIGTYWMARSLKDPLFASLIGFQWVPFAKILSVFVGLVVVLIYGKLVDLLKKHHLFYVICSFYSLIFLILSYSFIFLTPGKILGWLIYVTIESSSILIPLFWAFVVSVTQVESAKKAYAMIFFVGQMGQFFAPMIVMRYAQVVGSPALLALAGCVILFAPLMMKLYMTVVPQEDIAPPQQKASIQEKTGFLEGFKLLITKPYVMGIFVVATSYEIIGTVLDFQMKWIASTHYTRDAFAAFNGKFGMCLGILSMAFAFLGTSFFMRKLGLRFCLISYPTMIAVLGSLVLIAKLLGVTDISYMWILFGSMIAIKGLNYTLNNPTKEVMYIPTSKDVKFKVKSWIDVFGNRTTKSIGSGITGTFRTSLPDLAFYGILISLGVVGFWILIATLLGKAFDRLQKENRIIE